MQELIYFVNNNGVLTLSQKEQDRDVFVSSSYGK